MRHLLDLGPEFELHEERREGVFPPGFGDRAAFVFRSYATGLPARAACDAARAAAVASREISATELEESNGYCSVRIEAKPVAFWRGLLVTYSGAISIHLERGGELRVGLTAH